MIYADLLNLSFVSGQNYDKHLKKKNWRVHNCLTFFLQTNQFFIGLLEVVKRIVFFILGFSVQAGRWHELDINSRHVFYCFIKAYFLLCMTFTKYQIYQFQ